MGHYWVQVVEKDGPRVKLRVSLQHVDIGDLGTDRLFAWGLLVDATSGALGDPASRDQAASHVRRVSVGTLEHGNEIARDEKLLSVESPWFREGERPPGALYDIEVFDAATLDSIEPETDFDSWAMLDGPPLPSEA